MGHLVLLGPQRLRPTLAPTLDAIAPGNEAIAAVTAGWQEREAEVEEMTEHLKRPVVNLRLHRRAEILFEDDPPFAQVYRQRQDTLREMQRLYRIRLAHVLAAARAMMEQSGVPKIVKSQRRAAIQAVRSMDKKHLEQIQRVHQRFVEEAQPARRKAVAFHRDELKELLDETVALAIAGGHVATLLNRLRLFDLVHLAGQQPIVAWSAGAMVLGTRIILFHDRPPQGPGDAEILDAGLGAFDDLVPLPHARRRLRLDDKVRVALFARRFGPAACITLDEGCSIERASAEDSWQAGEETQRLTSRGRVRPMKKL